MEKRKKRKWIVLLALLLILPFAAFHLSFTYGADGFLPGSNEDPLITKSYLEERLSEKGGSVRFRKLELKKRQKLYLKEGGELVVYKGNASVKGKAGLINLSRGLLFREGDNIVKYNIFLAPERNCGIIANDAMTIFVSGGYEMIK